jgi:acyl carrier protein
MRIIPAMTHEEIEREVISIITKEKTLDTVIDSSTPLAEAGIDSLDALNILFALEERFQISIPDDRAREIRTLGDMVSTIEDLVATRTS